ncbi:hypothetical protein LguiA_017832 [Lonicera macranthoides]
MCHNTATRSIASITYIKLTSRIFINLLCTEIAGNSVSSAQGRDHLPGPPRRYLTQPHRHTLPHAATQAYATSRRHKGARYNNTHVATKAIRYRGSIPRSIAEESSLRSTDTKNPQFLSKTLALVDLDGGGVEDDDEHDDDEPNLATRSQIQPYTRYGLRFARDKETSIRSRHAVAEATISGTQAFSCNKKRGVVTGKKTAAIIRKSGKSRVTYDPAVSGPPKEESYDIDLADKALVTEIQKTATDRFKDWKYKIHKNWQAQGDAPIPVDFIHCPNQWQWLCNHFKAEDFQELGMQMTQIWASENKKAHTVQSARTAELEKMMAGLPPIDEASDGTSPASALALVLSYKTQVSVLERAVGPSRRTRLRANQVAINEQLQRERAERETERAEREREKVDFERKLQAQIDTSNLDAHKLGLLAQVIQMTKNMDYWPQLSRCPETWITGISNLDAHKLGLLDPLMPIGTSPEFSDRSLTPSGASPSNPSLPNQNIVHRCVLSESTNISRMPLPSMKQSSNLASTSGTKQISGKITTQEPKSLMPTNLTVYGHVDQQLESTIRILRQQNVGIVIHDEAEMHRTLQESKKRKREAMTPYKGKGKGKGKQNDKENQCPSIPVNKSPSEPLSQALNVFSMFMIELGGVLGENEGADELKRAGLGQTRLTKGCLPSMVALAQKWVEMWLMCPSCNNGCLSEAVVVNRARRWLTQWTAARLPVTVGNVNLNEGE